MLKKENPYKITIVAPTCLYYQVKLFQTLASNPKIELNVCFCSKEALESKDIPTLYMTDKSWGPTEALPEHVFGDPVIRNKMKKFRDTPPPEEPDTDRGEG